MEEFGEGFPFNDPEHNTSVFGRVYPVGEPTEN